MDLAFKRRCSSVERRMCLKWMQMAEAWRNAYCILAVYTSFWYPPLLLNTRKVDPGLEYLANRKDERQKETLMKSTRSDKLARARAMLVMLRWTREVSADPVRDDKYREVIRATRKRMSVSGCRSRGKSAPGT